MKLVRSVRNRPSSSSGLIPSSTRLKTLRISRSPNTTELLLCSAADRLASSLIVSGPRRRVNVLVVEPTSVPLGPLNRRRRAIADRRASANPGGPSAS